MRRGLRSAGALRAVLDLGSLRSPAGKKASIAHFVGGARNVARSTVELPTWTFVRARAHSFPLSKRARLFPSAAYRRSSSPQLAWGQAYPPAGWDVSVWLGNFAARMNRLIFLTHSRRWAYSPLARWNASMQLVYFCNAKGQREFEFTLVFIASHEACRRMAVFTRQ